MVEGPKYVPIFRKGIHTAKDKYKVYYMDSVPRSNYQKQNVANWFSKLCYWASCTYLSPAIFKHK